MKLTLEIELGDEAMLTGNDVINSLRDSLKGESRLALEPGVGGALWTVRGDTVGKWTVSDGKPGPEQPTAEMPLPFGAVPYAVTKPGPQHYTDSDCTVDPRTHLCVNCGVEHGEPCQTCGGKGFHTADCPNSDANR